MDRFLQSHSKASAQRRIQLEVEDVVTVGNPEVRGAAGAVMQILQQGQRRVAVSGALGHADVARTAPDSEVLLFLETAEKFERGENASHRSGR